MLYDDRHRLAFVHMPKTGGTFVSDAMVMLWGAQHRYGEYQHQPCRARSLAEREGYRLFGVLRSPWAWYQSLYSHALRAHENPEHLPTREAADLAYKAMKDYGGGSVAWSDVLYGMTHLDEQSTPAASLGLLWGRSGQMVGAQGAWSWFTSAFFGPAQIDGEDRPDVDVLLRFEEGLPEQLAALTGEPVADIRRVHNRNRHPGSHPELTGEHLRWILLADGALASRFGYRMIPQKEVA